MLHEFIAALEGFDPANRLFVFYSLDYQINEPQFGFLVSNPRLSGQSIKLVVIIWFAENVKNYVEQNFD